MKYIFGGFIECSGTLDNGKEWRNFNVLAARCGRDGSKPMAATIIKVKGTDENFDVVTDLDKARFDGLEPCFTALFDERGRAVELHLAD